MSHKSKSLKRLRGLNEAELVKEEHELRTAVWKMQLQRATGQIADSNRLQVSKRDLARVLTIRRETASSATGK